MYNKTDRDRTMYKRFLIETVRSARANGGMGCGGWHPGPAIAEIKVNAEDGEKFYLSISVFEGTACFYKTENSTFEEQIEEVNDDDFWDSLDNHMIVYGDSINMIILERLDDPLILLYKYLSVIVEHVKDGNPILVNQFVDEILDNMKNYS